MATPQLLRLAGNPASDGLSGLEHGHVGTESSAEVSPDIRKHFCLQQLPVSVGIDVSLQTDKIGSENIVDGTPNTH